MPGLHLVPLHTLHALHYYPHARVLPIRLAPPDPDTPRRGGSDSTDSTTGRYPTPDTAYAIPSPVTPAESAGHTAKPPRCGDSLTIAESAVAYSARTAPAPARRAPTPSTSPTPPESARPPSRPRSVNVARRATVPVDHTAPPAHYTAAGDFPSATSLDLMLKSRDGTTCPVEKTPPRYFCQSIRVMRLSSSPARLDLLPQPSHRTTVVWASWASR